MTYYELFRLRTKCRECMKKSSELIKNPHEVSPEYDLGKVGLWEYWQGRISSPIVVVGQDWGDEKNYNDYKGRDANMSFSPTNYNLVKLFNSVGFEIDKPGDVKTKNEFFFTNAILCLKTKGGAQGRTRREWFSDCIPRFLQPMLEEIVRPKVIIVLGKNATIGLWNSSQSQLSHESSMWELSKKNFRAFGANVFPVYHCGQLGMWNRYRDERKHNPEFDKPYNQETSLALHKEDWARFRDTVQRVSAS